ncbi:MAG: sulfotransferase [Bacteroidota bacterium]|nr:sulfotransferase [Bacteroidota bacterium]
MKVDFFIVGAPKAGTTSLFYYLKSHPDIIMSSVKEPNYFTYQEILNQNLYYKKENFGINTLERYHALFPPQVDSKKFGEGSVSYLFYPDTANKIYEYNPNAKIIIMLRDPIERAFSHYLMDYRLGYVTESFQSIIQKESKHPDINLYYQQYVELGLYYQQVKRYINIFGADNTLLINYSDFQSKTQEIIKKVFSFLDVDPSFSVDNTIKHNEYHAPRSLLTHQLRLFFFHLGLNKILPKFMKGYAKEIFFVKKSKPILDHETKYVLNSIFKDDIVQLEKFTNKEWKK